MSKWKEEREAERLAREEAERKERLTLPEVEAEMRDQVESANLAAFKARRERDSALTGVYTDARFYFVVCFNTHDQMNEALAKLNFPANSLYLDGHDMMREVGRPIESPDIAPQRIRVFNKDYTDRAME